MTTSTAILARLMLAALKGDPCPTNLDLVGVGQNEAGADFHLKKLLTLGAIAIERHQDPKRRRIQIVSTGEWTGWTLRKDAKVRRLKHVPTKEGLTEAGASE